MGSKMDMLNEWITNLVYPGKVEDFIKVTKEFMHDKNSTKEVTFYTDEYRYRLYAVDRPEDDGYLGCQVSARKARAGEDWRRGNDLPDGPFSVETWNMILNAIINYELVELSKFQQPESIPPE